MTDTLRDLVELAIVVDPTFDQNCYVLHRRDTADVLIVDPGLQHAQTLGLLEERGWRCDRILLTHGHPDHVSGVPAVKAAFGCEAAIHPDDREQLEAPSEIDASVDPAAERTQVALEQLGGDPRLPVLPAPSLRIGIAV